MARRTQTRYTPRKHYTAEELVAAAIRDLEVDIEDCGARGVHPAYVAECRAEVAQLKAKLATASGK